ncbi:HP1 family phage holin [Candidatus Fukatsuia endosymbiont of Tuberolachnus salignus]|uniref:HP1 family phage holin n=1 Tax=Candidatus Fukatsuia endosymbiont of Tuberolachnus salignus TaxID=3077957 RepID=UPI00313CD6BF
MDRHTSWLSYSSAWLLTCLGAWTLQDWATLIGVVLAMGTYLNNRYYKRREDQRQQEIHALQRQQLTEHQRTQRTQGGQNAPTQ